VTVSQKSQAGSAPAWLRKKAAHVVVLRSGAGTIPPSLRNAQTVRAG
jgi:hypothetical protein